MERESQQAKAVHKWFKCLHGVPCTLQIYHGLQYFLGSNPLAAMASSSARVSLFLTAPSRLMKRRPCVELCIYANGPCWAVLRVQQRRGYSLTQDSISVLSPIPSRLGESQDDDWCS